MLIRQKSTPISLTCPGGIKWLSIDLATPSNIGKFVLEGINKLSSLVNKLIVLLRHQAGVNMYLLHQSLSLALMDWRRIYVSCFARVDGRLEVGGSGRAIDGEHVGSLCSVRVGLCRLDEPLEMDGYAKLVNLLTGRDDTARTIHFFLCPSRMISSEPDWRASRSSTSTATLASSELTIILFQLIAVADLAVQLHALTVNTDCLSSKGQNDVERHNSVRA